VHQPDGSGSSKAPRELASGPARAIIGRLQKIKRYGGDGSHALSCSRNCFINDAQQHVGICDRSWPESVSIDEVIKSISIYISLNNSWRPYIKPVLSSRVHPGKNHCRIIAQPFEHTLIAPEQVQFRSIMKFIRE